MKRRMGLLFFYSATAAQFGCVERILKVDSDPQGARVFVNDEEVGVTPAKFAFLWYGDYDILIRKEGYETLKTHYRVNPPWYQVSPFDFIAETMIPAVIRDEHETPLYTLVEAAAPPASEVVGRAEEMRSQTLFMEGAAP